MTSPGSPSPRRTPSSLERTPPPPGTSASEALPVLDGRVTLQDLRERAPRLPLEVTAQLENVSYLFHKVRQDIREHQEQLEHFSQLLEACSQALDTPTQEVGRRAPGERGGWESKEPGSRDLGTNMGAGASTQTPQPAKATSAREGSRDDRVSASLARVRPAAKLQAESGAWFWGAGGLGKTTPFGVDSGSARHPAPPPPSSWDPEDFEDAAAHGRLAVPHKLDKARTLRHGELVLAAAVSSFTRHAFTCSRGGVKVWSLTGQVAEAQLPESHLFPGAQTPGAYLRACLLTADNRTLLVGGHKLASVSVWDLAAPALRPSAQLPCAGGTCQALAANPAENLAFASFTDGMVRTWDLRSGSVVRDLPGPPNCAKSIVVRDQQVWAGGLDACLRCWDLRAAGPPLQYPLESQIMSLAHCPQEDWLLLGLANGQQWLRRPDGSQARMAGHKDSAILALRFSAFGRWWVSVGTDDLVSIYTMPLGAKVFQVPEATAILCCDVSSDSRLVVTGAGDCASVYQVTY
ncbi:transducin-like enhancer protein 6 [Oryctolagus cuniculus]|uniref:transducin-like enhancer protein 6 n=1 Tax=Oryctolagus cuniculus TaxID=9986 RepID=UPI00387A0FCF